jgi:ribosomal protein S18 acetylase RimI-like enzyme
VIRAPIRVRRADPGDERRLFEIDRATWSPLVTPAPQPAAPFFRPGVEPDDTLLALVDGRVAGYALIGGARTPEASAHVLMLRGLAVDPQLQRRGVGRALLDAAVEEARSRGAHKLSLRVLSTNEAARRLYETAGFEVEGVLRDEFLLDGRLVDDLLLARRLRP